MYKLTCSRLTMRRILGVLDARGIKYFYVGDTTYLCMMNFLKKKLVEFDLKKNLIFGTEFLKVKSV